MIYKSSSLLSENVNKDFSLNRMAQTPQSYTVCVLQLNEELQRIETDYNISEYRALKEAALNETAVSVLKEGVMSSIGEAISKAINAIISFIRNIIDVIRGKKKTADIAATKADDTLKNIGKTNPEILKKIEGTSYDDLIFYKSISNVNANALKEAGHILITDINNILAGKKVEEDSDDDKLKKICYTELSKSLSSGSTGSVENRDGFRKYVSETLLASEKKSATGKEFVDYYDKFVKEKHDGSQEASLEDFRKMLDTFGRDVQNKSANFEIDRNEAKKAFNRIKVLKELSDDWAWFISLNENNRKTGSDYFSNTMNRMISTEGPLTPEFKSAVKDKNLLRVRIMLKDMLIVDMTFAKFNKMLAYAKQELPSLIVPFDNGDLEDDSSKWNMDLMNKELVELVNNFSETRINHLKKVIPVVFANKGNLMKSKQESSIYNNKGSVIESTTIHGEIFDSETLFANEDTRDFNSTEWLDLELTTECYSISCAAMETRRSMALQEAIIMSEDAPGIETFRKLCAMQEVEMNKFRDNISKIIANIKEFISKFISEIQDKYGKDAALMKKYGDSIRKNPIKLGDAKTTGNIIEGIERLNADKTLPSFTPETMNEKEKLDMFEKHFLSLFSDSTDSKVRSVQWNRDVESPITSFCKAYYGASMPEEKYTPITYTSDNLEAVKTKLIDFATNPHIFFHKIKMNLSRLEAEAKKIGRTTIVANNTNTNQNNNQNTNNNQQNANNNSNNTQSTSEASFYSVLYDRWFNEVDFASGNPSPSGSDNKDNVNTNNNELESAKDFAKTYVEIVKDILLSKLTAARFIYAECMAIMRAHAKMYNNKTVVNNTQQQNQNVKK